MLIHVIVIGVHQLKEAMDAAGDPAWVYKNRKNVYITIYSNYIVALYNGTSVSPTLEYLLSFFCFKCALLYSFKIRSCGFRESGRNSLLIPKCVTERHFSAKIGFE